MKAPTVEERRAARSQSQRCRFTTNHTITPPRGHFSVAGRKQTMRWIAITAIGLTTLLSHPGQSWAQAATSPHHFALTASNFPAGSRVIAAHVESNARVTRDRVLHFGRPFLDEGRVTGYFMDAIKGTRRLPRVAQSYLVSIFGTTSQAVGAFGEQRYYWNALAGQPEGAPGVTYDASGTLGSEALYRFTSFDGWTIFEDLIQRGPILVEVFLEVRTPHPSPTVMKSFLAMGSTLDSLCVGI